MRFFFARCVDGETIHQRNLHTITLLPGTNMDHDQEN